MLPTLDELAHIAGAVAFVLVAALLPFSIGIALGNAAFWLVREWEQDTEWPWHWSWHKHREWLWPTGIGALICAVLAVT